MESMGEEAQVERKKGKSPWLSALMLVLLVPLGIFGFGLLGTGPMAAEAVTLDSYSAEFLASAIGEDSPPSPAGAIFPHIVYRDGTLFVRGVAMSEDEVATIVGDLVPLFGEENIVAELVIDPAFAGNPNDNTQVYFAETVLFESGSAVVAPQFRDVLGASVAFLQLTPDTTIEIFGHTDDQGDEESNLALSQRRVDAARQEMIDRGGDPERLTATGFGESSPIADNDTAEGRAENRRVELTINSGE